MSEERVYTFKHEPKPGWPCPRCGGRGVNADGSFSMGTDAIGTTTMRIRDPSKCFLCKGSGRVNCTPIPEGSPSGSADE